MHAVKEKKYNNKKKMNHETRITKHSKLIKLFVTLKRTHIQTQIQTLNRFSINACKKMFVFLKQRWSGWIKKR